MTNVQYPNHQRRTNLQSPVRQRKAARTRFAVWDLGILWNLVIGSWSFRFCRRDAGSTLPRNLGWLFVGWRSSIFRTQINPGRSQFFWGCQAAWAKLAMKNMKQHHLDTHFDSNPQANLTRENLSRRAFLKHSSLALAGAAALAKSPFVVTSHAAADTPINIGVIGCGGRGTGALMDALGAATRVIYPSAGYHTEDVAQGAKFESKNIKVVALADLFPDRLARCRENLQKLGINLPNETCFTGFDAYQKLLAVPEINYVILATPPHFRPMMAKAAIEAGKNVFMEKPVAVDPPGVRMIMEAGELAKQKKLGIVAGTQRRHLKSYQETIKRIHDGAIGEIVYGRCYWNGGEIWVIDREPGWSDMEWQLRNWNYFTWLAGDHIVEQHVHNLDVMNWVIGTHPIKALGPRRAAGAHGQAVRPHFRPLRRGIRIPERRPDVQPVPADQRLRRHSRGSHRGHQGRQQLLPLDSDEWWQQLAFPRPRRECLPAGARGSDRQHSRRGTVERGPHGRREHDDRDHGTGKRLQRPVRGMGPSHEVQSTPRTGTL